MDSKKVLIGTLGGTVVGAGICGIKGLEKGVDLGIKISFMDGAWSFGLYNIRSWKE